MEKMISSAQNNQFKEWRKLHQAKQRRKLGQYIIEGDHLVQEALNYLPREQFGAIIMSEDYQGTLTNEISPDYMIKDSLAPQLSQTQASQGIFAVVKMPDQTDQLPQNGTHYLLVDAVQDPGNLGTMIRTADAFNYDAIILGDGTVDLYNDKVLRSTQGSLWHLPIIQMPLDKAIDQLKAQNIPVLATALNQVAKSYKNFTNFDSVAIIVGNEGQGVNPKNIDLADESVFISMPGRSESLNVAVATGILLSEFTNSELN